MELVILIVLALGFIAAWIAHTKGRNVGVWFVLGCLFGILALPIIVCLPKLDGDAESVRGNGFDGDYGSRIAPKPDPKSPEDVLRRSAAVRGGDM